MCSACIVPPVNTALPVDPEFPILIVVPTGAVIASLVIISSLVSCFLVRRRRITVSRSKRPSTSTSTQQSRVSYSERADSINLQDNVMYGSAARNVNDLPLDSFIASPSQVPPTAGLSAGQAPLTHDLSQHSYDTPMTRNAAYDHHGDGHPINNVRRPSLEDDERYVVMNGQEHSEYSYITSGVIQDRHSPPLHVSSPPSPIQYEYVMRGD